MKFLPSQKSTRSSTTVQAVLLLSAICVLGVTGPKGYFPLAPTSSSATVGLTGSLDTNGNMNLSWLPSQGATSYAIDREIVSSGVWQSNYATSSTTNYQDIAANYGYGGFRYRVHVNAAGTNTAIPTSPFPSPSFAVIDLGTNQYPMYVNALGSIEMVKYGTYPNTNTWTFWKSGTNVILPFQGGPLNNNDQVAGLQTELNYFVYPWYVGQYWGATFRMPSIWSFTSQLAVNVPPPPTELDTGNTLSPTTSANPFFSGGPPSGINHWSYSYGPFGLNDNGQIGVEITGITVPPPIQHPSQQSEYELDQSIYTDTSGAQQPIGQIELYEVSSGSFASQNVKYEDPKSGIAIGTQDSYTIGTTNIQSAIYIQNTNIISVASSPNFGNLIARTTGVNSIGEVLGKDNTGTTTYWNSSPATTNLFLSNAPAGFWNAQHQIVTQSGVFWQSQVACSLGDLVPDNCGWSNFSVSAVAPLNDSGEVIATAQQTQNADGTPAAKDANGNFYTHGLALLPVDLVQQTTTTSGQYQHIDYPPFFLNDNGVGRGPSPGQTSPKGLSIILGADLTATSVGSMTASIGGPGGYFNGTLTETAANSGVFTDVSNTVTLNVPVGTTTSSTSVDTLSVTVNSTSLGLNNTTFSLVESGTETLAFYSPIVSAEIILSNTYNPAIVNNVQLNLQVKSIDPEPRGGTIPPDPISVSMTETFAGSRIFSDPTGNMTVSLGAYTGVENSLTAAFPNFLFGTARLAITLTNKSNTPLDFTSDNTIGNSAANLQGANVAPNNPAVTGAGVFYIRVKGLSVMNNVTVQTDVGAPQPVTFSPLANDPTTLLSGPLLIIPQSSTGSTSYSNITTLQSNFAATAGSIPDTINDFFDVILSSITYKNYLLKATKPAVNMFIGKNPITPSTTDLSHILAAADSNLNLNQNELVDDSVNKSTFLAEVPLPYAMYLVCHGVPEMTYLYTYPNKTTDFIRTDVPFQGIAFDDDKDILVTPTMVHDANKAHKYTLVFLNGCDTAKTSDTRTVINDSNGNPIPHGPFVNQVKAMYTAFNCTAYVGWTDIVGTGKGDLGGELFFQNLKPATSSRKSTTVQQAIQQAMDTINNNGFIYQVQSFTDGHGGTQIVNDTAALSAPLGGDQTANQVASPP